MAKAKKDSRVPSQSHSQIPSRSPSILPSQIRIRDNPQSRARHIRRHHFDPPNCRPPGACSRPVSSQPRYARFQRSAIARRQWLGESQRHSHRFCCRRFRIFQTNSIPRRCYENFDPPRTNLFQHRNCVPTTNLRTGCHHRKQNFLVPRRRRILHYGSRRHRSRHHRGIRHRHLRHRDRRHVGRERASTHKRERATRHLQEELSARWNFSY